MIRTFADILEAFKLEQAAKFAQSDVRHPRLIGNMYEALTQEILERAIPESLDLRVVGGDVAPRFYPRLIPRVIENDSWYSFRECLMSLIHIRHSRVFKRPAASASSGVGMSSLRRLVLPKSVLGRASVAGAELRIERSA